MTNTIPKAVCAQCGEFLPHWCAPVITIRRAKWTGAKVVTIKDRQINVANRDS